MNQILQTGKENPKKVIGIRKIVIIFCIILFIFAILLITQGGFRLFNSFKENDTNVNSDPLIDFTISEDNKYVNIDVKLETGIKKIIYNWNDETEKTVTTGNTKEFIQKVELISGTNTLNLKIVDSNGNENTYQKEYSIAESLKPKIEVTSVQNTNDVKITVTDESTLEAVSYRWNNDEEVKVETNGEKKVEVNVEVPIGQNTLKISAKNTAGESKIKEKEIKGVTKPKLSSIHQSGDIIRMELSDDIGISYIETVINGQTEKKECNNAKTVEHKQQIDSQTEKIEFKVYNIDGVSLSFEVSKTDAGLYLKYN